MKCIIDGDIIAYSCAAACEGVYYEVQSNGQDTPEHFKYKKDANNCVAQIKEALGEEWPTEITKRSAPEPLEFCINTVNHMLCGILEKFCTNEYTVYLTGKGNFREKTYPEYKANRKDVPKPTHLQAVREYLIEQWEAVVVDGQEADDAMAIEQMQQLGHDDVVLTCDSIICSTDKDLNMIPGNHYNWTKDEKYWVSEEEGIRNFYKQLLTGDSVDNIPGIIGIGPKKAEKILEGYETEEEMYEAVLNAYRDKRYPDGIKHPQVMEELEDEVIRNARLLWMRRREGEIWSPPGDRT